MRSAFTLTSRPAGTASCTVVDVLTVESVSKQYGEMTAVDRISFAVARNEIVGLLGPNGAGKTTTINMVLGVLEPTSGTIRIEGIDVAAERSKALECTNFAAVYAPLPGNLTVYQNLRIFWLIYSREEFIRPHCSIAQGIQNWSDFEI
jgi:ABC-2 type transport system ATP-binding protein